MAARARERKERKARELQIKQSKEKCDEGRVFLEPEGKAQPHYTKAINLFDAAIEIDSENADAFTFRANAYLEQKQPDQAIEDYTKALSLNPQSVMSLEGRASCYEALHQWDKAIMDYTSVTGIQPENDHSFNMRGCCRLRKRAQGLRLKNDEFDAVEKDFMNALRLNENNFHAFTNLGKCYEEHAMYKKAIAAFTKALNVKDDYQYTMFRRGCAALSLVEQERAKAQSHVVDVDRLTVDEQIAFEEEAEKVAKEHKDFLKQAVVDFTKVIGEDKEKEPTALVYRGTCFFHLKEFDKANEDYNSVQKGFGAGSQEAGSHVHIPILAVLDIKVKALQEEWGNKK